MHQRANGRLVVRDQGFFSRSRYAIAWLSVSIFGIMAAGTQLIAVQDAHAATRTAAQVLTSSQAAAKAQSSFHYVTVTKVPGTTLTLTGDVSASSGEQTVVYVRKGTVGHLSESLVGGLAYVRGDEPGLVNDLGMPSALATQYANQWISVTPSDPNFDAIATALTTSSALAQAPIKKSLSLRGTEQKMGRRVLVIGGTNSGTVAGSSKRLTGPVRLYVNDTGTFLPVFYSSSAKRGTKVYSETASFGGWGEAVSVTAPTGAVPIASIGSSGSAS
jgi:hypothetical protein